MTKDVGEGGGGCMMGAKSECRLTRVCDSKHADAMQLAAGCSQINIVCANQALGSAHSNQEGSGHMPVPTFILIVQALRSRIDRRHVHMQAGQALLSQWRGTSRNTDASIAARSDDVTTHAREAEA